MHGKTPDLIQLAYFAATAFIAVVLSTLLLRKLDPIFARVLLQK
jgi:ABC-type transporter Mla maintaining outer membrane lipid asymmetry permease subunit MlaE